VSPSELRTAGGLPVYFTRFIGRERELDELYRLITGPESLVTLLGVGGSGKTRLAVELARTVAPKSAAESPFPDGVGWVDLAVVSDSSQLLPAVAEALGLHQPTGIDLAGALIRSIEHQRVLLVLDNCEELVAQCHDLADTLLGGCPQLVILATSRVPLQSSREKLVAMPALQATPGSGLDASARSEAAGLFYDRAGLVLPAYAAQSDDTSAVNAVCQRLDGLPLAIELAAPWVRVLSATDLLAEIERNIDVLSVRLPVGTAACVQSWTSPGTG
jgi:predicted ATPase